ncbi:hypothetical protein [Nonomuraea jabiensis]|uniref:hypothetical protein n=1 Tax=Nonomuraea jabiensis TaxID=882448 RepID=UPI003D70A762
MTSCLATVLPAVVHTLATCERSEVANRSARSAPQDPHVAPADHAGTEAATAGFRVTCVHWPRPPASARYGRYACRVDRLTFPATVIDTYLLAQQTGPPV